MTCAYKFNTFSSDLIFRHFTFQWIEIVSFCSICYASFRTKIKSNQPREGVKERLLFADWSVNGGGGQPPLRNQNIYIFFCSREKDAECFEQKYAKIFCEILARLPVKHLDIVPNIFLVFFL